MGIVAAVALAPREGPYNPTLPPSHYPYLPPPKGTDVIYAPLGICSGFGMLAWCVAFRRVEPILARIGWFASAVGILIAFYLPAIT